MGFLDGLYGNGMRPDDEGALPENAQPTQGNLPPAPGMFGNGLLGGASFNSAMMNPMVMMGLGMASGKTPQEGLGNAATMGFKAADYQRQREDDRQSKAAVYAAALKMGLSPQEAMAFAASPQATNMLQQRALEQQKLEQQYGLEQQKINKPVVLPYGATLANPNTGEHIGEGGGGEDAKAIAEGIKSGKQPPITTGLYRMAAPVRAELAKSGFDLENAQLQDMRAKKQIQALNGPQMTRFQGLAMSVDSTIDEVRGLSKEMELSGIPLLNKAELAAYIQTQGNSANGQLATRYVTAVNTLKEEFANLAQGGYAPTESVWHLANKQINENYGVKQMGSSLDEVQRLIRYRINAIPNLSTLGATAPNPYIPGSGQRQMPQSSMPPSQSAPTVGGGPIRWGRDKDGNPVRLQQ